MDQAIVIHSLASWRRELVTMVLVPKMSQKSVQMEQEDTNSARYAMAKILVFAFSNVAATEENQGFFLFIPIAYHRVHVVCCYFFATYWPVEV